MTIGVLKPGSGRVRYGGFRSGGRNLLRGGASAPIRHRWKPKGAISVANRLSRFGNAAGRASRLFSGRAITIRDVQVFFNGYLILKKTFDAELRFLDKMGAYIKTSANRSMRSGRIAKVTTRKTGRQKGDQIPSKPGTPPRAWPPKPYLKKFNYWFVNPLSYDVIVGPVLLDGSKARRPVPGLHEYGKTTTVRTTRLTWRRRKRVRLFTGSKRVKYEARPFMRPALAKNLSRVSELRKSIK